MDITPANDNITQQVFLPSTIYDQGMSLHFNPPDPQNWVITTEYDNEHDGWNITARRKHT